MCRTNRLRESCRKLDFRCRLLTVVLIRALQSEGKRSFTALAVVT